MTDESGFLAILRAAGVAPGAVLLAEAPFLEGPCAELFALLKDAVRDEGTLAAPTCTPQEGRPKPTFDPLLSPSEDGDFSEFFRKQTGVVRSHHPTHSVAAWGSASGALIEAHRTAGGRPTPWGDGAFGEGSPWDRLYELNAFWVLIGADAARSHLPDFTAALHAARHANITRRMPFPRFDARALAAALRRTGLVREGSSEFGPVSVFRTRSAVDAGLAILENTPSVLAPSEEFRRWLVQVERIRAEGYLRAGAARVKITPPVPCLRWDGRPLEQVYRDLYARVLFLAHGAERAVLVLCDLLGISSELVRRIRESAQQEAGLKPEAILVACTHSHSTPDTMGSGYENPGYLASLVETITGGIRQAAARAQSARLGWSRVPIRGLAASRRVKLIDGSVFTTRYSVPSTWRVDPRLVSNRGEIDPDLTVIRIEDLEGRIIAGISNLGCHASAALMSRRISGDFPGEAMAALERVFGDSAVILCTNGAGADVDPTFEMPFWGPRNQAMAAHLGRIFAAQVLESLERVELQETATLAGSLQKVALDVRRDWLSLIGSERERMTQEFAGDWTPSSVILRTLEDRRIRTEVHAIRLNDLVLVGFPGEVFAGLGRRLKDSTRGCSVVVVELANDDIGYIPTPEAFSEGGYEVGRHLWGRATPDAAEQLLEAAQRAIGEVIEAEPAPAPVGA